MPARSKKTPTGVRRRGDRRLRWRAKVPTCGIALAPLAGSHHAAPSKLASKASLTTDSSEKLFGQKGEGEFPRYLTCFLGSAIMYLHGYT